MEHYAAIIMLLTILIVSATAGLIIAKSFTNHADRALYFSDDKINDVVGTTIDVDSIYGRSQGDKLVDYMYLGVRLRESSDPLSFYGTLFHIVVNGQSGYYTFDSDINCSLNPYVDNGTSSISNPSHVEHFGITHQLQIGGDEYSLDFITQGDLVQVCLPLAGSLREAEEMRISIIPDGGGKSLLVTNSPDILGGEWIELWEKLV